YARLTGYLLALKERAMRASAMMFASRSDEFRGALDGVRERNSCAPPSRVILRWFSVIAGRRWSLIHDCLVHERAQLGDVVDVSRGYQLGHVDDNQLFCRIDPVLAVIGAAPAKLADGAGLAAGAEILDHVKAEAEAFAGGEGDIAQVIDGHQLDGLGTQDALPVKFAALQHHLQETRVVFGSREQARATREAFARAVDVRALSGGAFGRCACDAV